VYSRGGPLYTGMSAHQTADPAPPEGFWGDRAVVTTD
jgi:hypothetical protein